MHKKTVSTMFWGANFFDADCAFKNSSSVDKEPLSFAATNWLASANGEVVRRNNFLILKRKALSIRKSVS